MIPLYTSYVYARSTLERAFLEIGQFAHVTEKQMTAVFDDVENATAQPFSYMLPPPNGMGRHPVDDYESEWEWTCDKAHTYAHGELPIPSNIGFAAEPMARLLHHRHGLLCQFCMNPDAEYIFRYGGFGFETPLHIGRTYDGGLFPTVCKDCQPLACIYVRDFDGVEFFKAIRRQLKKQDSPLVRKLRVAPKLRFEPRGRHAA